MKNILFIFLASFGFCACEKIVDIEIPSEAPRLVIESQIYNIKDLWKVKLSSSQPYFNQDSAIDISTAIVYIYELGGDTVYLHYSDTGMYVSSDSHQCIVGQYYQLNVLYKGETYSAIEELQNANPIDTLMFFFLPPNDRSFPTGNYVFIQGQPDTTRKNFYVFKTYKNDTLNSTTLDDDAFGSVTLLNSNFNVDDILGEIANDKQPRPIEFGVKNGDVIVVDQFAVSEQYYNFLGDLIAQRNRSGTPFDPPPANPNNNLNRGAMGYFSVAHKETARFTVVE